MTVRCRPSLLTLALLCAGGLARAEPPMSPAAQLEPVPKSPAFRMEVDKSLLDRGDVVAGHPGAPASAPAAAAHGRAAASAQVANAPASSASSADATDPLEHLRQRLAEKLGAKPTTGGRAMIRVANHSETGENVISSAARPTGAQMAALRRKAASTAGAASAASAGVIAGPALPPASIQWDYTGAGGPAAWARLRPDYAQCGSGQRQSPIDIRGGIGVDLEPIQFDYHASPFSVTDTGHTVQVDVEPGNTITVMGRRYELKEFHFHRPSEERIDGRQFDMDVDLVHRSADGHVAVVALLLDRGTPHPVVQSVWNNLPLEKGDPLRAGSSIDLAGLLPIDRRYYTYMGSLTTPPCSEGVLWMVMKQPVAVSPEQVAIFSRLYPMNARPVQEADGRLIKQSN